MIDSIFQLNDGRWLTVREAIEMVKKGFVQFPITHIIHFNDDGSTHQHEILGLKRDGSERLGPAVRVSTRRTAVAS